MELAPSIPQTVNTDIKFIGNVPFLIDRYDPSQNTFLGTNLRNDEPMEIRLATVSELRDFYIDHSEYPSQTVRTQLSQALVGNRDAIYSGYDGQIIHLDGVMSTPTHDWIAGFYTPFTTDPERDIALRGSIEIVDITGHRAINLVQPHLSEALSSDNLYKNLSSFAWGFGGTKADGVVAPRPLVTMRDKEDRIETAFIAFSFNYFSDPIPAGKDAFKAIKLTDYNHRVMAAIAGRIGQTLETLNGFEALPKLHQDTAQTIYSLANNGMLEIAIAPGFSVDSSLHLEPDLIAADNNQTQSGPLTGRGFYEADVCLKGYTSSEVPYNDVSSQPVEAVNIKETNTLLHPDNPFFSKRTVNHLAAESLNNVAAREGGVDALRGITPNETRTRDSSIPSSSPIIG